ncbi:MAG: hypothetical protein WC554_16710 [Clostridia bacterium]|jgi:hypothetical protein
MIFLYLLFSILAISLVDCITTELYFKPKWRAPGADAKYWDNWYHIRTVIMFGLWYLVAAIWFSEIFWYQILLHIGGWEDFTYALWVPFFVKAKEAWKWEPGYEIGPWIFPYEWHWLSEYNGFWKFLKYFCMPYWFGGSRVKFLGILQAMIVTFLIIILWNN